MKKIFLLAIAAFALTSCNNDENYVAGPAAATITATIGESTLTRATDSEWTAGDEIGISSLVGNQDGLENPKTDAPLGQDDLTP